jgi:hypothetical protein
MSINQKNRILFQKLNIKLYDFLKRFATLVFYELLHIFNGDGTLKDPYRQYPVFGYIT